MAQTFVAIPTGTEITLISRESMSLIVSGVKSVRYGEDQVCDLPTERGQSQSMKLRPNSRVVVETLPWRIDT